MGRAGDAIVGPSVHYRSSLICLLILTGFSVTNFSVPNYSGS